MRINLKQIIASLFFITISYSSYAEEFNGEISFPKCVKNCNAIGDHEIKIHKEIDFYLRLSVEINSYQPTIKVVNLTKNTVNWSFHVAFLDNKNNIIATYALSGETKNTSKFGQHNSSSIIKMNPDDMKKISNYKVVLYTL